LIVAHTLNTRVAVDAIPDKVTRLVFKYRLSPTESQDTFLQGELREACSLYNAALQERAEAWNVCRKSINYYDQASQLKAMRADGCLSLANFSCCQDVLRRVDKAYVAFFVRVKRGCKPGFPRYRSSRRYDSITFPAYGDGCKLFEDTGKLRIQGAGHIKINLHRPLGGKIKNVTIKREAGRWYACFSIERDISPLPVSHSAIGADVGLASFAVLSDGTEIANPRHSREAEAKMRRCQRKVARRRKGSMRRRKAVLLLQRANVYVRNQRADFHHKISHGLIRQYGLIAVEDLNIKGLASGMLSKSVNDAGWSVFIKVLAYKAEDAGRRLVKVDPRGTSQTCTCGARVPKALYDRWHHCAACGLSANRDHVSAQVILQRAGNLPSGANVEVLNSCVA
jgi:putative transposase